MFRLPPVTPQLPDSNPGAIISTVVVVAALWTVILWGVGCIPL